MGELCRIARHLGSGIGLGVHLNPASAIPARSAAIRGTARSLRCLFEIALVFVRRDLIASFIVNANHSVMERLNCVRIRLHCWQRSVRHTRADRMAVHRRLIDAGLIFAGSDFVNVL